MLFKLHYGLTATDDMPLLTRVQRNRSTKTHMHMRYLIQESITTSNLSSQCTIREWNILPEDTV